MEKRFLIKLHKVHEDYEVTEGPKPTAYAIAKKLGLNENTIRKYLKGPVITDSIHKHIVILTDYYNVDWRDPEVIETILVEDEGEVEKQMKTPHADAA